MSNGLNLAELVIDFCYSQDACCGRWTNLQLILSSRQRPSKGLHEVTNVIAKVTCNLPSPPFVPYLCYDRQVSMGFAAALDLCHRQSDL